MSAATPIAIVSHQNVLRWRQKPSVLEVRCVAKKSLALSERIYFGLTSSMVAELLCKHCCAVATVSNQRLSLMVFGNAAHRPFNVCQGRLS